jgi:copper transport protein
VEDTLRSVVFPLVRFSGFAATALLFGLLPVLLLVLRPGFDLLAGRGRDRGRRRVEARLEGFVQAALWAAATATVLALALQAALVGEFSEGGDVSQRSLLSVFETTFGRWVGLRLPLLIALAVLLTGRIRTSSLAGAGDGRRSPGALWWGGWSVLAFALLATSSFSGHAAVASPRAVSLINDIVHLTAGASWFTGIVVLAIVLPDAWRGDDVSQRLEVLRATVVRFSNLALVSIGIVLVTGTVNSLLHVGTPSDLFTTSYGVALSAKILLFVLILVLGGVNHLVVRRRLERHEADAVGTPALFRRVIAAELAVALAVMGATGLLTGLPRTRQQTVPAPVDSRVTAPAPSP